MPPVYDLLELWSLLKYIIVIHMVPKLLIDEGQLKVC